MSYPLPPLAVESGLRVVGDRRAALWLLSVPLLAALVAFAIAVIATLMGEMAQGSPRFYAAALSFSTLLLSVMLLPAYLLSLAGTHGGRAKVTIIVCAWACGSRRW